MISARSLSFSYQSDLVLDQVDFAVANHTIAGLAGPNGAGKSTLFKLLTGQLEPDFGHVQVVGSLEYVPQEVKNDPAMEQAKSIRDYLDPTAEHRDYDLEQIMAGLGLSKLTLDQPPLKLSGGQKTKLALARALLVKPQNLLLDEPTNFLDSKGKRWVMDFLANYPHTIVMVSHDLDLLDRSIKKVLYLNPLTKKVEEYRGNYTSYLSQRADRDRQVQREITKRERQIKSLEAGLKRMKFTSGKGVRRRIVQQRRIERIKQNLPELPPAAQRIKVRLPTPAWVGHQVLSVSGLTKSFGNLSVLDNVSFELLRGQRLALIGPNGAGKSTLIKIIMSKLQPDVGQVAINQAAKIGYYSQEFGTFDLGQTLLEAIESSGEFNQAEARSLLGKFMFSGNKVNQKVGTLSGGEKTRLAIARLLLKDFNLLILDEPTTYLDLLSQRAILEALKEYTGSMIVVSHTEDFIKELEPQKALLLPENRFTHWDDALLDLVAEI